MAYCDKCGAELKAGEIFCAECGAKAEENKGEVIQEEYVQGEESQSEESQDEKSQEQPVFCPSCGTRNSSEDRYCLNCGEYLAENGMIPSETSPIPKGGQKKNIKKLLMGGAAVVAVAAVAAVAVSNMKTGSSKGSDYLLYYKDNSLYQYGGKKTLEITDHLVDGDGFDSRLIEEVEYSKDGKYVFYLQNYDNEGYGNLYYLDQKKQSDKKDTAVKLDSYVQYFTVLPDNRVIYVKEGDVYVHNLKEKSKAASDVRTYRCSEDGQELVWLDTDGTMYHRTLKADSDKEKLDSDVANLYDYTKDLKTIYYMKDSALYCMKSFEKEKVASDVKYVGGYNNREAIYYMKMSDEVNSIDNIFVDDMAEQDMAAREPDVDNYKRLVQAWGRTYYETDSAAYNAAQDAYQKVENRNAIREALTDYSVTENEVGKLFCYDGTESRELLNDVVAPRDITFASRNIKSGGGDSVFLTYSPSGLDLPKIRMSEVNSFNELDDKIEKAYEKALESDVEAKLVTGGAALDFQYNINTEYMAVPDGGVIYAYVQEKDNLGIMEYEQLESMKYSKNGVEPSVTLDDDLQAVTSTKIYDGMAYYLKDYNSERGEGELFCNGEAIEEDVFDYDVQDGVVYILKDRNKSSLNGTLVKYENKQIADIADDIFGYSVMKDGKIAALLDFSQKRQKGDLYLISGKDSKKEKLDEDVTYIYGARGSIKNYY